MQLKIKNTDIRTLSNLRFKMCLLMLVVGLISTSCGDDALEEEVFSSFTGDDFYKDAASAELGLFGVYDVLASESLYNRGYLLYFHTGTDQERYWRQNRGLDDDLLANYQIMENNDWIGRAWTSFYNGIYRVNLLIERVTALRDDTTDTSELDSYNSILGDAHFLRAFMYFQLVKNWGDVPLRLTADITLETLKAERAPKEMVYQQIEKDMIMAIGFLPDAANVKSPARISKGAAQGIFSRIYLNWAGAPIHDTSKFQKAAEQAYAVVSSGNHELNGTIEQLSVGAPFDHPFPQIFKNLSENVHDPKENMWEIHYSYVGESNSDASTLGAWHGVTQNTKSSFKRGSPRRFNLPTFFDSFEGDDAIRRDYSIAQFEIDKNDVFKSVSRSKLKWGVGKYRRYLVNPLSPNNNYDVINFAVVRYADVLLMLSESINETIENGGTLPAGISLTTAYESINQVRRRARILPINTAAPSVDLSGAGGDTFRQEIRDERSWELCNENLRRPDLIRWGILVETVKQTGADMVDAGYTKEYDYFPAHNIQDHHVLLPIPFGAEISQNPDILNTDPSNNGYR